MLHGKHSSFVITVHLRTHFAMKIASRDRSRAFGYLEEKDFNCYGQEVTIKFMKWDLCHSRRNRFLFEMAADTSILLLPVAPWVVRAGMMLLRAVCDLFQNKLS